MTNKSRSVAQRHPIINISMKAERDALYNDAPLNLLRTSCRKAAKSECVTLRHPIHRDI